MGCRVYTWSKTLSCEDEHTSGHPNEVATEEITAKICIIILADCRLKAREIAEMVRISTECVHKVLDEYWGMKSFARDGCCICSHWN